MVLRVGSLVRPGDHGPELFLNRDGQRMSRDGFAYRLGLHVAAAAAAAPSIASKRVTPHVLRHSCAMHTLEATGDVQHMGDSGSATPASRPPRCISGPTRPKSLRFSTRIIRR